MADQQQLSRTRERKKALYEVRTRHLDRDGEPLYTNRLINEDSPYLLQHAHNPVDWYPWGDDAFARSAELNRPVFLSIGYSTCHWCHVMEEESFDDEEVAEVLNRHFISIKVDREQRPDLDEIYMTGVQLLSRQGGWPMSSFLTAEGKPFFGATYFPKDQFINLLQRTAKVWQEDRSVLMRDAERLIQAITDQLAPSAATDLSPELIDQVLEHLVQAVDRQYGGFGDAPKFPQEPNLLLLLEQIQRDTRPLAEQAAWSVLSKTLDAMLQGGLYDQLAGGFHRYSTDRRWLVPHFEKMLYNQGQLASVYLWAWELSGNREYRRIVEETLDYLLREMRSPDGGFYSATDADTEGEEGKFFVWDYAELAELLDSDALGLCEQVYGVSRTGNFEGANVLHLARPLSQTAQTLGMSRAELDQALGDLKKQLYQARSRRIAPLRDDKQITEWNGMVIAVLARAGEVLDMPAYKDAAIAAAQDLWRRHFDPQQKILWRITLGGEASIHGTLEDYAHFLNALIALYDATGERHWLSRTRPLFDTLQARFWDPEEGGFFITPVNTVGPQLVRSKSLLDGATVSGNSLILRVMIALYERTGEMALKSMVEQHIRAFSGRISQQPLAGPVFLQGLLEWKAPPPKPVQYLADGAIRVRSRKVSTGRLRKRLAFTLEMQPGWHVQSATPASPERIATQLTVQNANQWHQERVEYPPGETLAPGGSGNPESVYQGAVTLTLEATAASDAPLVVELQLQPCTEQECLLPETCTFLVYS